MRIQNVALALALATAACTSQTATRAPSSNPANSASGSPTETSSGSAPNLLDLTCDRRHIELASDQVVADDRGVHIRVTNDAPGAAYFQFAPGRLGPWGGSKMGRGTTDFAIQLSPGTATMRCSDGYKAITDEVRVVVLDPNALFRPYALECGRRSLTVGPSIIEWSRKDAGLADPVVTVRRTARGIAASDVLELAGYPQAANPVVRLVRAGDVIAEFDLEPDNDAWSVSYSACADSGVSIPT